MYESSLIEKGEDWGACQQCAVREIHVLTMTAEFSSDSRCLV